MDEWHAQKRRWGQMNEKDDHDGRAWRRQSLPMSTRSSLVQEDSGSQPPMARPSLPSIAAALEGSESQHWDASQPAAAVDPFYASSRHSPLDLTHKRPRYSHNPYPEDTRHRESSEIYQLAKDVDKSRAEGSPVEVGSCHRCGNLDNKVESIVAGLLELEQNLRRILAIPSHDSWFSKDNLVNPSVTDICSKGLEKSLEWSVSCVSIHLKRTKAHPTFARVPSPSSSPHGVPMPTREFPVVPSTLFDNSHIPALKDPPASESEGHLMLRNSDNPLSRQVSRDEERRQQHFNYQPLQIPNTAQDATSPSVKPFAALGRPLESPSPSTYHPTAGRLLPSPTSVPYLTSPVSSKIHQPIGPAHSPPSQQASSIVPSTAHITHLHDLQHEISKKTLALTTLQKEHESLLAAYGRQQTRCATLDKKTQVSDNEINVLTEEKMRLQAQVEQLESQVEDLINYREEAHKQNVANSSQYMQIMAMSSKLQAQGAEEARKQKVEREKWEEERLELKSRIIELENKMPSSSSSHEISTGGGAPNVEPEQARIDQQPFLPPSTTTAELPPPSATTASHSLTLLQQENANLKQTVETLERRIQQMSIEAEEIDRAMSSMMRIRSRASDKAGSSHAGSVSELGTGDG